MHSLGPIIAAVILSGCAIQTSVPPEDGYVRVKGVEGCWRHVKPKLFDVRLGAALEGSLRDQLKNRTLQNPQCWFEDKQNHLILETGNACIGRDEIHFHFAKVNGTWQIARVDEMDIVALCHMRQK